MDKVLRGLNLVFVDLDDILIASKNPEEHCRHLSQVFDRIQQYGINMKKSELGLEDTLSRIYSINASPTIYISWIANLQTEGTFLQDFISRSKPTSMALSLVNKLASSLLR